MPKYWFRQKKFGYGATPNSWQGWALMTVSSLAVFGVILSAPAIRDNLARVAWIVGGSGRAGRGRVLSRSEAFFSLTGLFIPALGGLLAGPFGWRVAFVLGALAAVVGLLAIVLATRASSAARAIGLSVASESPSSRIGDWRAGSVGSTASSAARVRWSPRRSIATSSSWRLAKLR